MTISNVITDYLSSTEPVYTGHTYNNVITKERMHVLSVGNQVTIERQDAKRTPRVSVPVHIFRQGIADEFIIHEYDDSGRSVDNV